MDHVDADILQLIKVRRHAGVASSRDYTNDKILLIVYGNIAHVAAHLRPLRLERELQLIVSVCAGNRPLTGGIGLSRQRASTYLSQIAGAKRNPSIDALERIADDGRT